MITLELLGALMVLAGVVYMAWSAIHRGRMSDPAAGPSDADKRTLEPRHRGLGFLGWEANWPGLLLAGLGVLLLLSSLLSPQDKLGFLFWTGRWRTERCPAAARSGPQKLTSRHLARRRLKALGESYSAAVGKARDRSTMWEALVAMLKREGRHH